MQTNGILPKSQVQGIRFNRYRGRKWDWYPIDTWPRRLAEAVVLGRFTNHLVLGLFAFLIGNGMEPKKARDLILREVDGNQDRMAQIKYMEKNFRTANLGLGNYWDMIERAYIPVMDSVGHGVPYVPQRRRPDAVARSIPVIRTGPRPDMSHWQVPQRGYYEDEEDAAFLRNEGLHFGNDSLKDVQMDNYNVPSGFDAPQRVHNSVLIDGEEEDEYGGFFDDSTEDENKKETVPVRMEPAVNRRRDRNEYRPYRRLQPSGWVRPPQRYTGRGPIKKERLVLLDDISDEEPDAITKVKSISEQYEEYVEYANKYGW
ncbi:MAG: hypothetical protein [Cressdnaviricota sp.]|nr:MAG: hypothetical protein [Cressdnaviricota sp.]